MFSPMRRMTALIWRCSSKAANSLGDNEAWIRGLTVQEISKRVSGLKVAAVCAIAISLGMQVSAGHTQELAGRSTPNTMMAAVHPKPRVAETSIATQPPLEGKPVRKGMGRYYVDFRARTAASYGHAFVWYGRTDEAMLEVAGLHPASDSPIPYVIGHVLPVPAEIGASYGDLDEQYVTAHYRVFLTEPDAKRVFAYIKQLQQASLLWHGPTWNCIAFIGAIASYMGLKTPSPFMYPEDYVKKLEEINGGRKTAHLTAEN
jgi:hypothetical protein